MIVDLKIKTKIKLQRNFKLILYFTVLLFFLSSIKTDFGWRPYHNFPFLKQLYLEGWKLILKDRYSDIKKEFKDEFVNFESIAIFFRKKPIFILLLAVSMEKN